MMQTLRNFGFGTPKAEEKIKTQLANLKDVIDASEGKPWSKEQMDECLSKATANVIMDILFGTTYDFDDADILDLIEVILEVQAVLVEGAAFVILFMSVFPTWFAKLVFRRTIKKAQATQEKLRALASKHLEEHRSRLADAAEPMDFLDAALKEFKNQPDITDSHIIDTLLVFLPDAIEGIASQIQWCIYFLVSHPSNQRRMVEEIKAACGKRLPNLQVTHNFLLI